MRSNGLLGFRPTYPTFRYDGNAGPINRASRHQLRRCARCYDNAEARTQPRDFACYVLEFWEDEYGQMATGDWLAVIYLLGGWGGGARSTRCAIAAVHAMGGFDFCRVFLPELNFQQKTWGSWRMATLMDRYVT